MLGLVSFLLPMGEFLIFKRPVEPWSMYMFVEAALTAYAVYWWYVIDRRERNFRTGAFQNMGVIFISVVALPIYFIRSRGWGRGTLATLAMLGLFIVAGVLTYAGEYVGRAIAF